MHDSVPTSNDKVDNIVVGTWAPQDFDISTYKPGLNLPHHEVLLRLEGCDPARGVKLVGHRDYCLTGYGMLL